MLLKLLSPKDMADFIAIAELLTLCDKPLLWDGKKLDEITPLTNFEKISIQQEEKEIILIKDFKEIAGSFTDKLDYLFLQTMAEQKQKLSRVMKDKLLEKLKSFSLQKINNPATRLEVSLRVVRDILAGNVIGLPSVAKIMLFELLNVALIDGGISGIKWSVLGEFKLHHKLEDYIFNDILERAETTSRELNKTLTIIFE